MKKNGVSIIIITYNRKEELKKTLKDLSGMECRHDYEIIVIDQNSDDGTELLFPLSDVKIQYIRLDKNHGVAGGRNIGAAHASYEYMVFLDDDACFEQKNALDMVYDRMEKHKEADLFAFQIRNLDGGFYNWPYKNSRKKDADGQFLTNKYIGCGHAIRKSFFERCKGYSECLFFWGEETELVLKSFAQGGEGVLYSGDIKVIHRVHGNGRNSTDAKRFYYQVRNRLYMIRELFPVWGGILSLYYKFGYLMKAVKKGWMQEYKDGRKDMRDMPISDVKQLSFINWVNYVRKNI